MLLYESVGKVEGVIFGDELFETLCNKQNSIMYRPTNSLVVEISTVQHY
jgi:hypothetical protein